MKPELLLFGVAAHILSLNSSTTGTEAVSWDVALLRVYQQRKNWNEKETSTYLRAVSRSKSGEPFNATEPSHQHPLPNQTWKCKKENMEPQHAEKQVAYNDFGLLQGWTSVFIQPGTTAGLKICWWS